MERQAANIIASKALEAIKAAFVSDPDLKQFSVSDGGGSIGSGRCTLKFLFIDSNHKPTSVLGGELTDKVVALGAAGTGTKIVFKGTKYTVVKSSRKFYQATDESGKIWRVPFIGSTLAKS